MKGYFKTAYLQRELPLDIILATAVAVGDVVTLTPGTYTDGNGETKTAYLVSKVANSTAPSTSHFIVAQSDMTLKSGDVPVVGSDFYHYYYHDGVAANASAASVTSGVFTVTFNSGVSSAKKGAFYKVTNVDDVYYKN